MKKRSLADRIGQRVQAEPTIRGPLAAELAVVLPRLQAQFEGCGDVLYHRFRASDSREAVIVYINGLADVISIDHDVLKRMMEPDNALTASSLTELRAWLTVMDSKEHVTYEEMVPELFSGRPLLLVDGIPGALSLGLIHCEKRGVEEPQAESVIRGARDGFTETLIVNLTLLRKRLKTPALKIDTFPLGRYSKTDISVAFLQGIAKEEIVASVKHRLQRIEIDGIVESGMIEELIEDSVFSPFPQLQTTERPDVAVAAMLEGRVLIITDHTPFVMIAPTTLWSMLQSPEDYYERFLIGTLIRWLRYLFFLFALLAPSVYVATLTFHQEMVPTTLLLRITQSREEIPFPALMEALIMEITFEALREAGVRLPKQIGSAVSIVGALVIGQAAIQAGLVSAPMVMIVAITGIASFMLPQYAFNIALRILRFPIMIMSGMFGLYGLILCILVIISHLCILRSFDVPYLTPIAPIQTDSFKDTLIRAPIGLMKRRPAAYASPGNSNRQVEPAKGEDQ
ncbi:spore germination protein [Paenibacillus sp. CF384]|uniref:spore germination protein n=1 Tax=Paenibacillus sp. CF384 TaxID=1884382 RepID=UPI000895B450|nr:spore germination protein [Paenibacillus sp. CF384]SDW22908.1 spore germination protein KA [Paenibacillus sp. CF384]